MSNSNLRNNIFRHLDGLATAPIMTALNNKGILDYILLKKEVSLQDLTDKFNANEGYLNVALRVLSSQGFLNYHIDNAKDYISFSITEKTQYAFAMTYLYDDVVEFLQLSGGRFPREFEDRPFEKLNVLFEKYKNNYGVLFSENPLENEVQHQMLKHVEGYLVAPTIVRLGMTRMYHK